jgi:hypothetical protein
LFSVHSCQHVGMGDIDRTNDLVIDCEERRPKEEVRSRIRPTGRKIRKKEVTKASTVSLIKLFTLSSGSLYVQSEHRHGPGIPDLTEGKEGLYFARSTSFPPKSSAAMSPVLPTPETIRNFLLFSPILSLSLPCISLSLSFSLIAFLPFYACFPKIIRAY